MNRATLKIVVATALFGAVHSALASDAAKRTATDLFGQRQRNGLYRLFYIAQSMLTFGMLARYVYQQPSRELYRAPRRLALLMHVLQAGSRQFAVRTTDRRRWRMDKRGAFSSVWGGIACCVARKYLPKGRPESLFGADFVIGR
jgi:hypothetical protein